VSSPFRRGSRRESRRGGLAVATYFIRQNGQGSQGPFEESRIEGWIAQGRVRAEMEISGDGQRWMPVGEHRLFASAARPVPPTVRPVQSVEVVEEMPEGDASVARPRRARRQQAAPTNTPNQAAGIGCLGLLVLGAIMYALSSGPGGKGAEDDRGVAAPTTSLPGVFRSHEVRDGFLTKEGFDTWLVLAPSGGFEWYEKMSAADDWQLRLHGTWSSEKRRYTDSGGEYLGVDLEGDKSSFSFAFDDGSLAMTAWSKGIARVTIPPFSTTQLEKKSDLATAPSPIRAK
jgi:hypothetical protein